MARYTGPKFRLDRRERVNLFLKGPRSIGPKHPLVKKGALPPGQHGKKALFAKTSDYGKQLREKQKAKRMYGVLERQFQRYIKEATRSGGNSGDALLKILETRLDNVVYRLGFAYSRAQSRQLVNHGHVLINEKKLDIPSYNVKVKDLITIKGKAQSFDFVKSSQKESKPPRWLARKALVGKMVSLPTEEDLEVGIEVKKIIEFYSR